MPNRPKKVQRAYRLQSKPFGGRSVDNTKFYNSYKWRKFCRGFKERNPVCVLYCKDDGIVTATEVVDHKEQFAPGAKGWDLNHLVDENYNAACHRCHNKRSALQRHGKISNRDMG